MQYNQNAKLTQSYAIAEKGIRIMIFLFNGHKFILVHCDFSLTKRVVVKGVPSCNVFSQFQDVFSSY